MIVEPQKDRGGRLPSGMRKKWGVIANDLNSAEALLTTGPARADRLRRAVSPAPVAVVRITPELKKPSTRLDRFCRT
jgi:hypothetical protein